MTSSLRSYFNRVPPRRIYDSTSGPGPSCTDYAKVSSRERGQDFASPLIYGLTQHERFLVSVHGL